MDDSMITTGFVVPGFETVSTLGIVNGVTVRSASIVGGFIGGIQSMFGGKVAVYIDICKQSRREAFKLMRNDARVMKANAIIGVRYDATEVYGGITEVICYGTAVIVKPKVSKITKG